MQNWKGRDFNRVLRKNGYKPVRHNGSHQIYKNVQGNTISINGTPNGCIVARLIKENNLKMEVK